MDDRVTSFSIPPDDELAKINVMKLKAYAKSKSINFSSLVLKGIAKVVKELKL